MKITFIPTGPDTALADNHPKPAGRHLPNWYKTIPAFVDGEKKFRLLPTGFSNTTVKWCNPFLDSLTSGYFLFLDNDVFVDQTDEGPYMTWRRGGEMISSHSTSQITKEQVPFGYHYQPYKFTNEWSIKTPKNYSILITHPLNRTDLPFYTLSGIVDSDNYHAPINLPFLMSKNFTGIIEAGTPIAQIIPIKRESWTSKITKYNELITKKLELTLGKKIYRVYKNHFWVKKDYR